MRVLARRAWLAAFDPENAPEMYTPDVVLDDRRALVNAGEVVGAEAVRTAVLAGTEVFGSLVVEALAVRGERLAMYHWAYVQEGGFEAPGLTVIEMDDQDLVCRVTSFDESDLAAAAEFLEARHAELAGDAYLEIERVFAEAVWAFNRRDFDGFRATMAPDLVYTDRSALGFGTLDRSGFVETLQVFAEQIPDAVGVSNKQYARGQTMILALPFTGTTLDGSEYSWSSGYLLRLGAAGTLAVIEFFQLEQWAAALARFDEWSAEDEGRTTPVVASLLENAATRVGRKVPALLMAGDLDTAQRSQRPRGGRARLPVLRTTREARRLHPTSRA